MKPPNALLKSFERWDRAGRPAQVAARWNPASWDKRLPRRRKLFTRVAARPLTRERATHWAAKITDPATAVESFIVSMAWGHGAVGYGAYRTAKVMAATADFPRVIYRVAEIAQADGGVAAYRHISDRRHRDAGFLRYLGPAFGTKYVYFVAKAYDSAPAPIMDAVVQRWFQQHVPGVPLTLEWSSPDSYERFVDHTIAWATELSSRTSVPVAVDEVEHLIFASGAASEGSPEWAETWSAAQAEFSPAELLERLEGALDRQHRSEAAAPPLRALYDIVLDLDKR